MAKAWCVFRFSTGDIYHVNPPTKQNAKEEAGFSNLEDTPGHSDYQAFPSTTAYVLSEVFLRGKRSGAKKETNGLPRLHVDIPVDGCNCSGCYGEIDKPMIAIQRNLYDEWNSKDNSFIQEGVTLGCNDCLRMNILGF